jgi:hypothetical protein
MKVPMGRRAHAQFSELLDSAVRATVFALNAYSDAPTLKAIDAIRAALEEHGLAFAALGVAFPRVFAPGPTLEQIEDRAGGDLSTADTSPGFRSRFPPAPPPIGEGGPPPLPRRGR